MFSFPPLEKRKEQRVNPKNLDNPLLKKIAEHIAQAGGVALLVGGAVRDAFLGLPAKDLDIEVYGIEVEKLEEVLSPFGEIDAVGKSFGILKIKNLDIDISVPRRENKSGLGHKGFEIMSDPFMSVEEAQTRRDLTINSLAYNPLTGEVIDNFGGLEDLRNKVLRHTSSQFAEDPLRVLRIMQFAGRFDFDVAPETVELCQTITPEGLPSERLWGEWTKLICKGKKPSKGLEFLKACGWIKYYPELEALIGCPQDPIWHPEGDVWTHTLLSLDAFANEKGSNEKDNLVIGLAVLCHDLGKVSTTQIGERITSKGHESAGENPTKSFLHRLVNQEDLVEEVCVLVKDHLKPTLLFLDNSSDSAIRRLSRRVKRIDRLIKVSRADHKGRGDFCTEFPAGKWLTEKALALKVLKGEPEAIIKGRHLVEIGLKPSKQFGVILKAIFEKQIEGEFGTLEEGLEILKSMTQER